MLTVSGGPQIAIFAILVLRVSCKGSVVHIAPGTYPRMLINFANGKIRVVVINVVLINKRILLSLNYLIFAAKGRIRTFKAN